MSIMKKDSPLALCLQKIDKTHYHYLTDNQLIFNDIQWLIVSDAEDSWVLWC